MYSLVPEKYGLLPPLDDREIDQLLKVYPPRVGFEIVMVCWLEDVL